jgi:glycerol-3-phosphate acyltransferase PlsY
MLNYLLPVLAYFMGSISSAVVVSRVMGLQDPRSVGSGNPGATNMLRVGGKKAAVITLLGDILKGMLAVLVARAFTAEPLVLALVALMAFLGHLFPLFFGFRGGKGVATAFGTLVALSPGVGLALVITWVAIAALSRYSSLSAITAALLAPAYMWLLLPVPPYFYVTLTMAALLIWRHRANIRNLLAGTEGKIRR